MRRQCGRPYPATWRTISPSAFSASSQAVAVASSAKRARMKLAQEVSEGDELRRLASGLQPHGYEPRIADERMALENCPFDKVARDHTDLVCGLNVEFVGGMADGLGCTGLSVSLEPSPGRCCVSARRAEDPPGTASTGTGG